MRWFLKCYYGYQNLGDEILFFGLLDYIDSSSREITELTVEVGDERWMQSRRDRNVEFLKLLHLADGFTSGEKSLKFVKVSKNFLDNFRYDKYFFGGGEVFAESRWFHGWRNYLLRYPRVIWRKKFILLGGIETATTWRQRLLYRTVLPRAQRILCREETSYHEVKKYTDKVAYAHDFALTLIDRYKEHCSSCRLESFEVEKPYVLVNIVQSLASDDNFEKIRLFLTQHYPDSTPVFVAGKSVNSDDNVYATRLEGAYLHLHRFDRTEYPLVEFLTLFAQSQAWIASRLHILLFLQAFDKPRYALSYAEKVDKLITSTIIL